jgi:hypothetical protein
MLAFEHNAGGLGILGRLASDAETGREPISSHTAIEVPGGVFTLYLLGSADYLRALALNVELIHMKLCQTAADHLKRRQPVQVDYDQR